MLKPLTLAALLAAASHASAQCALPTATFGSTDPSGVARVGVWDPDGPGPLLEQPVIAGYCSASFPGSGFGVYAWDGLRWIQLASSLTFPSVNPIYNYITTLRAWDPDGPGPLAPRLLISGAFTSINGAPAAGVATWDGAAWSPLGAGLNGQVQATADWDPDGPGPLPPRLIAAGAFTASGAETIGHIAAWNGATWVNLGWGLDGRVDALTTWDPDGQGPLPDRLLAGGGFTHAGSDSTGQVDARGVAQWNGTAWQQLPGVSGQCYALTTWDHDGLPSTPRRPVANAYFSSPIGDEFLIQAWDGMAWSPLPNQDTFHTTMELASLDLDGAANAPETLYAICTGNTAFIRRWNGTEWVNVVPNLSSGFTVYGHAPVLWHRNGQPDRLLISAYAGYSLSALQVGDGAQWTSWGNALNGAVRTLLSWDPDGPGPEHPTLLAGGDFHASPMGDYISRWDGNNWRPLAWGADAPIHALTAWDPDGAGPINPQPIAAGEFTTVGSDATGELTASRIARWDGSSWRALGAGLDGTVRALTTFDPDGPGPTAPLLIAAGQFTRAGGLLTGGIASWNGTQWRPLGWGLDGSVTTLTLWDPDGPGPLLAQLVAAGDFTHAGANSTGQVGPCSIARWNGTAWTPMGPLTGVRSLVTFDADGQGPQVPQLLAGANPGLFYWSGTAWSRFANGFQFTDFFHTPYSVKDVQVYAAANSLAVWDLDGDGPALPQLFASGTYSFDVPPYQLGKVEYGGYQVTRNVLSRFNGLSFTVVQQDQPNPPMIVHDADGPGPSPSQLFVGGGLPPYIFSLATSPTLLVTSSPPYTAVRAGDTAQFSVTTTDGTPAYQWQYRTSNSSISSWANLIDGPRFSGATIAGSTSSTLAIANVTSASYGYFRCLIYDGGCLAHTTDQAYLQVRSCGTADFNRDGDFGTDADIESFFACLAGHCCFSCSADFNADGDSGTDADIESFFRVLAGGSC